MGIIENGITRYVHPTFLYESICTFFIFVILTIISKKRKFSGQVTYIYIILYSVIRAIVENFRIDSLMLYNMRISQIISIILFVIFCSILTYKYEALNKT